MHYNYDYAALEGKAEREYDEQYSAVGLLRNGKAVCQGYSELYAILLNKVGIPTRFVSSDGLNHAWNYVRIGGTWYHVDVTWDDCYQNRAGIMTHDFFLKTAGELAAQGRHTSTDWILLDQTELYGVQTSSRFSDAFWNGKGMVSDLNGKWAAYDPETHALMAYAYDSSSKTAAGTQLAVLTNSQVRWPVWEAPRSFWSADFVIPVSAGGALYYSTPDTIYTLSGGQPEVFYTLSSTEKQQGYLYGMYEDDGKLYYGIDTVPQDADRTNTAIRYYSLALADAPGQIETTTAATTVTDAATTTAATTTTTAATTTATVSSTTTTHITTTTTSATVTTTAGPLYCDFDRSGSLSAADAVLMLRFINEDWEDSLPVPDAALLRAADLDRDGCLTVHDVMQLFRSL